MALFNHLQRSWKKEVPYIKGVKRCDGELREELIVARSLQNHFLEILLVPLKKKSLGLCFNSNNECFASLNNY